MPWPRSPLLVLAACTADKGVHYYDGAAADSAIEESGDHTGAPDSRGADSGDSGGSDSGGPAATVTEEELPASDARYHPVGVLYIDVYGSIGDGEKADGWLTVIREHDGTLTDLDDAPVV